ncbi:DUF6493 family protein [Winogradskyella psychrotolerans]|uniref:DUF6493 family protein n=1 Tax=Winogradskyella psychrotolerans TaxID=1344585 RepID=UPI001C07DEEF|nr:DUF6493 family protein [Winogradskyella psychrotolerans]MBU2927699.1 hypothetical protein [Winogradskyella psychrotolerans]
MLSQQIEAIVKKEGDIIPLLKTLTPTQKRELVPFLKTLRTKIFERYDIHDKTKWGVSYSSKPVHSQAKMDIVDKACYVCFNKTDTKKAFFQVSRLSISNDYLENIIPWYKPKWFGDLINEEMPWDLTYEKLMDLAQKELFEPSQALILARLPNAIVESSWKNNVNKSIYKPEVLLKHKTTLDQHIWFLFEEASGINNYYNYLHLDNYKGGNDIWIDTFVNLTATEKLDRSKVLTATLHTSTKGFNKTLSGWFAELLLKLNPTLEEILSLQHAFFAALNSPHSKVANSVLKYFKVAATHKNFKHTVFIENASILLNSETKSVVTSTLMILDKIAKTHKTLQNPVCLKATEALINVDEKIQIRAAKIIEKYGKPKNDELVDEISMYADNLLHNSKDLLKDYLVAETEQNGYIEEPETIELTNVLADNNKIETYNTLDELIFFVSQAIDNNEVYHIDLLLSYLPKLNVLLNKTNIEKLEPIFKRALDLSLSYDWNSQIGNLEHEAAYYINDFSEILIKRFPIELASFKKKKQSKIQKLKDDKFYSSHHKENLKPIEQQSIPDYIYQIHHALFIQSKSFIQKNATLDLLSKPTHAPCWIDPTTLIQRIVAYEKQSETIILYDFQIAISRLPFNYNPENISNQIELITDFELRQVLKYHFNFIKLEDVKLTQPELWLQSVLIKNNKHELDYFQNKLSTNLRKEIGNYTWDCKLRDHYYLEYDYPSQKQIRKKTIKKELKLHDFHVHKKGPESLLDNLKGIFKFNKNTVKIKSIYGFMYFKKQKYYTTIQPHDDIKFLYLSPNNPSMLLSQVVHYNLKESTFWDESSKKNMINLLKGLYNIWNRPDYNEGAYLFLATGLLYSDKISRELAAEIWIKANYETTLDNNLLGSFIGRLEAGEYAPLKRFTDLLTNNLFNISKTHNDFLFQLLSSAVKEMNDIPIRGSKKLLEILLELKHSSNAAKLEDSTKEKLLKWQNVASVKPVIKKILDIK